MGFRALSSKGPDTGNNSAPRTQRLCHTHFALFAAPALPLPRCSRCHSLPFPNWRLKTKNSTSEGAPAPQRAADAGPAQRGTRGPREAAAERGPHLPRRPPPRRRIGSGEAAPPPPPARGGRERSQARGEPGLRREGGSGDGSSRPAAGDARSGPSPPIRALPAAPPAPLPAAPLRRPRSVRVPPQPRAPARSVPSRLSVSVPSRTGAALRFPRRSPPQPMALEGAAAAACISAVGSHIPL